MTELAFAKKRKHHENEQTDGGSSHKKARKDKKQNKKREKGRAMEGNANSAFRVVSASVVLSIPPVFAMEPMKGVNELLDSLVMRYVPALKGVMLSHANTVFLSGTARLKAECPFSVCTVGFDATVWSPQVGMKLTGKIKLCSPDHIALLVMQTFNVSIPRHHIETEIWEFQYGPAENDPEHGPFAVEKEEDVNGDAMLIDATRSDGDEETVVGGEWSHHLTGEKLGGTEGILHFTVIGLKIANQMLSLVGSLQDDPLSERHVPQPAVPATAAVAKSLEYAVDERHYTPLGTLEESSDEETLLTARNEPEPIEARAETKEEKKRRREEEKKAKGLRKKAKEERRAAKSEKERKKLEEKEQKKRLKEERKKGPLISGKDES